MNYFNHSNKKYKRQVGVSLPLILIVLAGVVLSAIGLTRSVDLNMGVAGNVSEIHSVTASNEKAFQEVYDWIEENSTNLVNTRIQDGYYSAIPNNLNVNVPGFWDGARNLGADNFGNSNRIIIFRMCTLPNVEFNTSGPTGIFNECAIQQGGSAGNTGNAVGFNSVAFTGTPNIFFKVFIRTDGVRGATVITERTISVAAV